MKYVQGPGALGKAGELLSGRYTSCFAVLDPTIESDLRARLVSAFDKGSFSDAPAFTAVPAEGECCDEEIDRLAAIGKAANADVILAAGGGKTVDIGKCVAARLKADSVIAPTIAASDAPTSSIAVMYTREHTYKGVARLPDNPYMILVDSEIIAQAPARFLAAGMGDALATKIEAERCMQVLGKNLHGFTGTDSALQLAIRSYDLILAQGVCAMRDVRAKTVTPAVEAVVEANILMSGVGWENCGLAIPHAFHGALTPYAKFDGSMHGERVALGVLLQLHYDGLVAEYERLRGFFGEVGLPRAFRDVSGGQPVSDDELRGICAFMTRPVSYAHNVPGDVVPARLEASLRHLAAL
ncbi:MAG: glycerol dehydrogenase [Candidatus Accumulibacter sp.]|jgi:glycerol dehydrogenase|nr:glycerol dehydrogenase [Accumulibacter sp.]